jgi:hypothetical protein
VWLLVQKYYFLKKIKNVKIATNNVFNVKVLIATNA